MMSFSEGSRCFLEGTHRCTIKFCGTAAFASGVWYGIEMDDPQLGKNDGSIDGVQYFECENSDQGGLFVRRGRLSESCRTRDTLDIPVRRVSETNNTSNIKNSVGQQGAAPLRKARSFNRRSRVKSSVDPREIQLALEENKSQKRIDKRARNMTIDASSMESFRRSEADVGAVHAKEADMRKDIMKLQKEHLKTLISENKHLNETNDMLVAHVASIESKYAQSVMKNFRMEGRLSEIEVEDGESPYDEVVSERDLAVHKLAEVSAALTRTQASLEEHQSNSHPNTTTPTNATNEEIAALREQLLAQATALHASFEETQTLQSELATYVEDSKNTREFAQQVQKLKSDNTALHTQLERATNECLASRTEIESLHMETTKLRQAMQRESVDVSNSFPNYDISGWLQQQQLHEPSHHVKHTGPVKRLFTSEEHAQQQQQQREDALRHRCELAEKRIKSLTVLIAKVSTSGASDGISAAVQQVTTLPREKQQDAFGQIAEKLSWDDLDAEVMHQNQELDKSFEGPPVSPSPHVGYGDDDSASGPNVVQSFAAIRTRLSNRLQSVLHQSNSIRIRSQAVTPGYAPTSIATPSRIGYASQTLPSPSRTASNSTRSSPLRASPTSRSPLPYTSVY
eukprot:m.12113 g.12113  ORF g.12113 m.12113 type:complete len:628 (-) comp9151_c0_seq1:182-2065(-)